MKTRVYLLVFPSKALQAECELSPQRKWGFPCEVRRSLVLEYSGRFMVSISQRNGGHMLTVTRLWNHTLLQEAVMYAEIPSRLCTCQGPSNHFDNDWGLLQREFVRGEQLKGWWNTENFDTKSPSAVQQKSCSLCPWSFWSAMTKRCNI